MTSADDLALYKRELLIRSEANRQALGADLQALTLATAWVPRAFQLSKLVSPLLLLAAPIGGLLLGRAIRHPKEPPPPLPSRGRRIFSNVLTAVRLFQQFKPLLDGLRRTRGL